MKKYLFLLFSSIMLWSCAITTKQLTPIEMKIMTQNNLTQIIIWYSFPLYLYYILMDFDNECR